MRVEIQAQAFNDLEEIYIYSYKQFGENKANEYSEKLNIQINNLIDNPQIGSDYSFIENNLQRLVVASHSVFYKTEGEVIKIIRVLHQRRDVEKYL